MIKLLKHGIYKLIETKNRTKMLYLAGHAYAWIEPDNMGDLLVFSTRRSNRSDYVLSSGRFNLYAVEDEPDLFDLDHLELEVGNNKWQGYLLLSGLPDSMKRRGRVIPTFELIRYRKVKGPSIMSPRSW